MKIFILITTSFWLPFQSIVVGQTPDSPERVFLVMEPLESAGADTSGNAVDSSALRVIVKLKNGAAMPSKIHLKAGTTSGAGNLLTKAFAFNGAVSYPDGTTYHRDGNVVYIGLGVFANPTSVFVDVWLENASGQTGTVLSTSSQ